MKSSPWVAANRGTVSNRRAKRIQTTARVDDCTIDRSQTPTHFVHRRLSRSPFPTPRRHHSCSLPFPFPIPFPIRRLLRFIFTFYRRRFRAAEDAAKQRGSARARSTSRDHQSIALRHDRRRRRTPELVQFLVVSRVAAEREREIVVERVVVSVRAGSLSRSRSRSRFWFRFRAVVASNANARGRLFDRLRPRRSREFFSL